MLHRIIAAASIVALNYFAQPAQANEPIRFHTIQVDGLNIFYHESGPANAPTILLLHGFPTSSTMYRNLIPDLATRYHVVAPDMPGFGFSSVPGSAPTDAFNYRCSRSDNKTPPIARRRFIPLVHIARSAELKASKPYRRRG